MNIFGVHSLTCMFSPFLTGFLGHTVKLVRGAYRATEDPGLLQPSKRDTDDEYNACMRLLLDEVAQGSEFSDGSNEQSSGATDPHLLDQGNQGEVSVNRPNLETSGGAALLLATHNRTSVSSP